MSLNQKIEIITHKINLYNQKDSFLRAIESFKGNQSNVRIQNNDSVIYNSAEFNQLFADFILALERKLINSKEELEKELNNYGQKT